MTADGPRNGHLIVLQCKPDLYFDSVEKGGVQKLKKKNVIGKSD